MGTKFTVAVVSDIHYASPAEQARHGFETRVIANPLLRQLVRVYRQYVWVGDAFAHNHLLERFAGMAGEPDLVVANGDYSCDTAFVGVGDEAAYQSATICLSVLRDRFGSRFIPVCGDHELGKLSLFGGVGGLRLASWRRATSDLGLEPFWQKTVGEYVLMGIVSSLLALPVLEPETLPEERSEWWRLRESHLKTIRSAFAELRPEQRVVLFCHDPTALPFLVSADEIRLRLKQIDVTVIGHLHTQAVLRASRILSGIPAMRFAGNTVRRLTEALRVARRWRDFNVRLCPSLTGLELLNDGGYGWLELDPSGTSRARWQVRTLGM